MSLSLCVLHFLVVSVSLLVLALSFPRSSVPVSLSVPLSISLSIPFPLSVSLFVSPFVCLCLICPAISFCPKRDNRYSTSSISFQVCVSLSLPVLLCFRRREYKHGCLYSTGTGV